MFDTNWNSEGSCGGGLTPEQLSVFERAMQGFCGVGYRPLVCLGTQVVAGMNYAFLCLAKDVYPGGTFYPAVVYVYRKLSGEAQIVRIGRLTEELAGEESAFGTRGKGKNGALCGGWNSAAAQAFADNSLANRALGQALDAAGLAAEELAYLGSGDGDNGRESAFVCLAESDGGERFPVFLTVTEKRGEPAALNGCRPIVLSLTRKEPEPAEQSAKAAEPKKAESEEEEPLKMSYRKTVQMDMYDFDPFGNVKTSRLTERFLAAGMEHLNRMDGWNQAKMAEERRAAVVVIENRIQITGKMTPGERYLLTTWTGGRTFPLMGRYFALQNEDGDNVAEAAMFCVLLDLDSRTLTNANKIGLKMQPLPEDVPEIGMKKACCVKNRRPLFAEKKPDFEGTAAACYTDLDHNGHVNTARYVDYTENLLGPEWFRTHRVIGVDARYEEEVLPGEKLRLTGFVTEEDVTVFCDSAETGNGKFEARVYTE